MPQTRERLSRVFPPASPIPPSLSLASSLYLCFLYLLAGEILELRKRMCPELEFNMSTGRDCFALPFVVLYLQAGDHSCFIYFSFSMTVGLQLVRLSSALKPIQDFVSHVKYLYCRNPVIFNVKLHNLFKCYN